MNSFGSLPGCLDMKSAISFSSNCREQLAMSQASLIRAATPWPDPPPFTSTEMEGSTWEYASAQAMARLTMVSDPMLRMAVFLPPELEPLPLLSPLGLQPVEMSPRASNAMEVVAIRNFC